MYSQTGVRKLCTFYQKGYCRYGGDCRFVHEDYSTSRQGYTNNANSQNQGSQNKQINASWRPEFERMTVDEFITLMSADLNEHIHQGFMYPFTSYGYAAFVMPGLEDKSVEEARFEYRMAETSTDPYALTKHAQQVKEYSEQRAEWLNSLPGSLYQRDVKQNLQSMLRKCQDEYRYNETKTSANPFSQQNTPSTSTFRTGGLRSDSGNPFGNSTSSPTDKAASFFAAVKADQSKATFAPSLFGRAKSDQTNSAAEKKLETSSTSAADFFAQAKASQRLEDGASNPAPKTQSSTSTKTLFGKPVGQSTQDANKAKDFFTNAVKNENKPKTLFGKPVGQTGNDVDSTVASSARPSYLGKSAADTESSSTRSSYFGKKTVDQTQTNKPKTLFGKVFGPTPHQSGEMDKFYYTDKDQLSKVDLDGFTAKTFTLGSIPSVLPPKELCV